MAAFCVLQDTVSQTGLKNLKGSDINTQFIYVRKTYEVKGALSRLNIRKFMKIESDSQSIDIVPIRSSYGGKGNCKSVINHGLKS